MPKKELLSVDQAISAIVKNISLSRKEEKINEVKDECGTIESEKR